MFNVSLDKLENALFSVEGGEIYCATENSWAEEQKKRLL